MNCKVRGKKRLGSDFRYCTGIFLGEGVGVGVGGKSKTTKEKLIRTASMNKEMNISLRVISFK